MSGDLHLRAHSPLGASAAERYINCPGSPRLAEKMHPGFPSTEADYTRHGVAAHKLVAFALSNYHEVWEILDQDWGCEFSLLEVQAMQDFLDLVRRRIEVFKRAYGGQSPTIYVEFPIHCPELHDLYYGKFDVGIVAGDEAEIIDYKHGAGIAVDILANPQLQMYAIGFISDLPEIRKVRLRISQPRAFHPDGPDRSWEVEVPELMRWFDTVLYPAMELADPRNIGELLEPYHPGEWCRFCPAKRACPALADQITALYDATDPLLSPQITDELLGKLYGMLPTIKMKMAAIETEVHNRNLRDPTNLVPGSKLVVAKGNRIYHEGAEAEADRLFGVEAYEPETLKSPHQLEVELGAKAKSFTKKWAYAPDKGYATVPISDKRKAVSLQKPVDNYQDYLELRRVMEGNS